MRKCSSPYTSTGFLNSIARAILSVPTKHSRRMAPPSHVVLFHYLPVERMLVCKCFQHMAFLVGQNDHKVRPLQYIGNMLDIWQCCLHKHMIFLKTGIQLLFSQIILYRRVDIYTVCL